MNQHVKWLNLDGNSVLTVGCRPGWSQKPLTMRGDLHPPPLSSRAQHQRQLSSFICTPLISAMSSVHVNPPWTSDSGSGCHHGSYCVFSDLILNSWSDAVNYRSLHMRCIWSIWHSFKLWVLCYRGVKWNALEAQLTKKAQNRHTTCWNASAKFIDSHLWQKIQSFINWSQTLRRKQFWTWVWVKNWMPQ